MRTAAYTLHASVQPVKSFIVVRRWDLLSRPVVPSGEPFWGHWPGGSFAEAYLALRTHLDGSYRSPYPGWLVGSLSASRRNPHGGGAVLSAYSSACSFWELYPCEPCPSACGERVSCVRGSVSGISEGSNQSSRRRRGWSRCSAGGNAVNLRLRGRMPWWRVTVTVTMIAGCTLSGGRGGGRGGGEGSVLSPRLPGLVARGHVAVGCSASGALSPLRHGAHGTLSPRRRDACGASFLP